MSDHEERATLPFFLRKMHDRLSAVEALLANIYARYYREQYRDSFTESQKSLQKAQQGDYCLYSNYRFIDAGYEDRVRNLIYEFFIQLDSIISMNVATETKQGFPVTLGSNHDRVNCDTPAYREKIRTLLCHAVPQYADKEIDQIYQLEPASDLVLRVWLKDRHAKNSPVSVIIKMLGDNAVRNDIVEKYGLFYRETSFYASLAEPIRQYTPACYYASNDASVLILEDLGKAVMGDQLYGYQAEEALSVINAIVDFHEYWLNRQPDCYLPQVNDPHITEIIPEMLVHAWAVTKKFFNPFNSATIEHIISDLASGIRPISDELSAHATVIHGDLRMENLLFNKMDLDSIVDWQLLAKGSPMVDIAYFLVQSGSLEARKLVEPEALALYTQRFSSVGLDISRIKFEYALATKHSLIIPIMGAAWDLQTLDKPRDIVLSAFHRTIEAIA